MPPSRTILPPRHFGGILFAVFLLTALLYGRTLSYQFVYDDDWRIVKNPAVQELQHPLRYIMDPYAQSGSPLLWNHTYRPLPTFVHAIDHKLWGNNPGLSRLQNLILHSMNGFLIACLGIMLFELSFAGALFAALFFIAHPMQTEAVVWVSELSGVLSVTWILLGIGSWMGYRQNKKVGNVAMTYIFLIAGFLTRETSVCLAPTIIAIDVFLYKKRDWKHVFLLGGMTALYLVWRYALLKQISQTPLWGGTLYTNLLNVIQTLPYYLRSIVWPHALRILHWDIPIITSVNGAVVKGAAIVAAYIFLLIFTYRKSQEMFVCLLLIVVFWLPGSNIVPLNTLFAERLLYPMMIALAWIFGWIIDAQPLKAAQRMVLPTVILIIASVKTIEALPAWKDEDSLWRNAAVYEPDSFFVWACLANAQMKQLDGVPMNASKERRRLLDEAEKFYRRALELRPAPYSAGEILVCLAEVNWQQGKREVAVKNAKEGVRLREDLRGRLTNLR